MITLLYFFFFKQKTAYEMRISDWSSDVCSSDLRIETVKILPPNGQNGPRLYGAITATGIARVEDKAPRRRRVFCMAVTSDVGLGRGRPSSWSSAIDQLCYGGGDRRRLMVLAAGNLRGDIDPAAYPDRNDLEEDRKSTRLNSSH